MRTCSPLFLLAVNMLAGELPRFATHELATNLKGGYQVIVADVNGDGKPDLIALASGMPELVWFENPGWQRHVLASGFNRMINCAFEVIDSKPVVVLAHEFNNEASKSAGVVSVLTPRADPLESWNVREIDRLPTSHRVRVLRLNGKPVFLNVPLTAADATPPDYRGHVPIVMYRPGVWKREVVSTAEEGVLHGVWIEKQNVFWTAGFLGIHRYEYGTEWVRTETSGGSQLPWPKSGSSDLVVSGGMVAAIEPWHGNQVVVYDLARKSRKVIDESLVDGHTISAADFNKDGETQFLAGFRGKGTSVFIYNLQAGVWKRTLLDDAMAAAACATADLNGDGRTDIACIGSSTANLKWYENLGR